MKKCWLVVFMLISFINVYAEDATLKNIKVNNKLCECSEYKCEMEIDGNSATITYDLASPTAKASKNSGSMSVLSSEVTTINISVEDGESRNVYEFIITKHVKNNDYSLKKLLLNEEEIVLTKDIYVYNASVAFDTSEIIIEAIPTDSKASVDKELAFLFPLDESSKSFDFNVMAENGEKKNYRLFVTRKNKPDTTLKSLKLDKGSFVFDKDNLEYEVNVEYNVTDVLVEALPTDQNATVRINKEDLIVGENTIKVEVNNQNAQSVYTIKVNREENIDKSVANLASCKIKEYSKLAFDPNVLEYTLFFNKIPSSLSIDAHALSKDGKIEIIDNDNLQDGSVVKVKVTLIESEISRLYTLNIKEKLANKNSKVTIIITLVLLIIAMIVLFMIDCLPRIKKHKKVKKVSFLETKNTNDVIQEDIEII